MEAFKDHSTPFSKYRESIFSAKDRETDNLSGQDAAKAAACFTVPSWKLLRYSLEYHPTVLARTGAQAAGLQSVH